MWRVETDSSQLAWRIQFQNDLEVVLYSIASTAGKISLQWPLSSCLLILNRRVTCVLFSGSRKTWGRRQHNNKRNGGRGIRVQRHFLLVWVALSYYWCIQCILSVPGRANGRKAKPFIVRSSGRGGDSLCCVWFVSGSFSGLFFLQENECS